MKIKVNYFIFQITDVKTNKTMFSSTESGWDPRTIFTTTNELRIESHELEILNMFYYSTKNNLPSGCGGEIIVSGNNPIYLKNPPYEGRNHSVCSWHLTVPPGTPLRISFNGIFPYLI